jgi:hypothetical protein
LPIRVNVFTTVCHWSVFRVRLIQSTSYLFQVPFNVLHDSTPFLTIKLLLLWFCIFWGWSQPLFQFLDPVHSRQDRLDGESARRKVSTYTQNNIKAELTHNTDIHPLGGIRTHDLCGRASEDILCFRPRVYCDRRF